MSFLQKLAARAQRVVESLKDDVVEITHLKPNELLFIRNCANAKIVIESNQRLSKLVLESCKNCIIIVKKQTTILTSMFELINSQGCIVSFDKNNVCSLQCDNSHDCILQFSPFTKLGDIKVFWSDGSTGNNIQINVEEAEAGKAPGEKSDVHPVIIKKTRDPAEYTDAIVQFRSTFNAKYELLTEELIREGGGYVTTPAEKQAADEKQEMIEKRMEQLVLEELGLLERKLQQKSSKAPAAPAAPKAPRAPAPTGAAAEATTTAPPAEAKNYLAEIASGKKPALKPTQTHVTNLMDVIQGQAPSATAPRTFTTSREEAERVKEHFDPPEKIVSSAKIVADYIKNAKHVVVYTGAGISTAAKIPDYRGPEGVWTLKEQGKKAKGFDLEQAYPTYSHYVLKTMMDKGLLKFVTSTNVDGLHRRSGIPQDKISELHGNCYREVCDTCKKEYLRGFDTTKTVISIATHMTGRKCECGGKLKDSIIHFGENLPEAELSLASQHARKADIALVLGTSMLVQPACSLPELCLKNPNSRLIIVNLQKTPYDSKAMKIHARTDEFMTELVKELGLDPIDTTYDALEELKQK